MKIILKWMAIIFLFLTIYLGLIPKYRFKYYYSKDNSKILTRVTYPNAFLFLNNTYLTPGKYEKHSVPEIYIKPIPENIDGNDWSEYVTFHSKGIIIIGTNAETKNLTDGFIFINGTVKDYSEVRKIYSIERLLIDTTNIALYRYKE